MNSSGTNYNSTDNALDNPYFLCPDYPANNDEVLWQNLITDISSHQLLYFMICLSFFSIFSSFSFCFLCLLCVMFAQYIERYEQLALIAIGGHCCWHWNSLLPVLSGGGFSQGLFITHLANACFSRSLDRVCVSVNSNKGRGSFFWASFATQIWSEAQHQSKSHFNARISILSKYRTHAICPWYFQ